MIFYRFYEFYKGKKIIWKNTVFFLELVSSFFYGMESEQQRLLPKQQGAQRGGGLIICWLAVAVVMMVLIWMIQPQPMKNGYYSLL